MSSVFERAKQKAPVVTQDYSAFERPVMQNVPAMPKPSVFPAQIKSTVPSMYNLIISDDDIDKVGENVSRELGQTTQKIITKMAVGKFDELGAILATIQNEANNLDPSSLQRVALLGGSRTSLQT